MYMKLIIYSDEEFDELFNFNISKRDKFLLQTLLVGTFVFFFIFIIYMIYFLMYSFK